MKGRRFEDLVPALRYRAYSGQFHSKFAGGRFEETPLRIGDIWLFLARVAARAARKERTKRFSSTCSRQDINYEGDAWKTGLFKETNVVDYPTQPPKHAKSSFSVRTRFPVNLIPEWLWDRELWYTTTDAEQRGPWLSHEEDPESGGVLIACSRLRQERICLLYSSTKLYLCVLLRPYYWLPFSGNCPETPAVFEEAFGLM